MEKTEKVSPETIRKAEAWLRPQVDGQTQDEVRRLLLEDHDTLTESFYGELEFGTGGLRGIMGVGTMRMNRYTVGMATQGLANYILKNRPDSPSVAIAYDSRNQSSFFAQTAADVLSANGIRVFLFEELRPTPLLSFAVRYLNCTAGIVVTASHNPKEYNGYKVYWEDGAQVLPPHDKGIINEVRAVAGIGEVKFEGNPKLIQSPPQEVETSYLDQVNSLIHAKAEIAAAQDLSIVFTPIHGAGITLVPKALNRAGFRHVHIVESQAEPDGNFPTVVSPNPEEKEALHLALLVADEVNADLLMGNDPDADRVGVAIRNPQGQMALLSGNQAGSILIWYELMQWKKQDRLTGTQYIASTIVTSELFPAIASHFGVPCYKTLTGFKYIAGIIREMEGRGTFVAGGEESYGYLVGEFVRDKDAVISSVKFAEIAAWCKTNGKLMWDLLMEIYVECGLYYDELLSITRKGISGMKEIDEMMYRYRIEPPTTLAGSNVVEVVDIQESFSLNVLSGERNPLDLPKSNVLQFILADGSRVSVRPSGTEPKIKFYFSFCGTLKDPSEYRARVESMKSRVQKSKLELGV